MKNDATYSLNIGGRLLEWTKPLVMGILNATPDSFFADSRKQTAEDIAVRARQIVEEGATIVDVGAYSTRPGASEVSEEEELRRLRQALDIVKQEVPDAVLSVDTFRASVAVRIADEYGPFIVNDVTGGSDPEMFATVSRMGLPYVLTNVAGTALPLALAESISRLREMGQCDIIIDPGFGFGKTLDENYQIMGQLEAYKALGLPLLVGVSRKSMIYRLLECTPDEALNGTTVLHTLALQSGADILRVHDVREAVETIRIVSKVKDEG
ncbi:MAG: dihydropteroate synthase [Bacteroidaceae bacterium]|nr:dihydropteroate synthase [Bacteroidaceae bacterium]